MMNFIDVVNNRHSCRSFLDKEVESDLIEEIVNLGRLAPSGGNNQSSHLLVITKDEVLDRLVTLVTNAFKEMEITEGMYKSLISSINRSKKGKYEFFYNAKVLIIVANKKNYGNALADSSCVLENMMLASTNLNLGSCWINQLHWLNDNQEIRAYLESLGLGSDEDITGGLAIGYPSKKLIPVKITGNEVTYIK